MVKLEVGLKISSNQSHLSFINPGENPVLLCDILWCFGTIFTIPACYVLYCCWIVRNIQSPQYLTRKWLCESGHSQRRCIMLIFLMVKWGDIKRYGAPLVSDGGGTPETNAPPVWMAIKTWKPHRNKSIFTFCHRSQSFYFFLIKETSVITACSLILSQFYLLMPHKI